MAPDLMVSKTPSSPKFFGSESIVRKLEFLAYSRNVPVDRHKEPPDRWITETPAAKHVWKPPPSRTTAPPTTTLKSSPSPRMKPPRFTGEDASNWIHEIQRYFNHSYTPDSDRLYLVTFLFDPPASEWATYWKEDNKGKGWYDFLIAVKHRFDPNSDEDYASNKATIEPPDSPAIPSDTRGWRLPPSLTQPPTGVVPMAFPRPHFDAPRFDGENVVEWIHNIQRYYNHCYMPLSDRLYLTKYLFDPPASDWMENWTDSNAGKGWDDFLLAVKQQFEPYLYEDYGGRVVGLSQTSSVGVVPPPPASVDPTPPAPIDPTLPIEEESNFTAGCDVSSNDSSNSADDLDEDIVPVLNWVNQPGSHYVRPSLVVSVPAENARDPPDQEAIQGDSDLTTEVDGVNQFGGVDVVSDDGVVLSITLDKLAATSGIGKARDETVDGSVMYQRATPVQKPHTSPWSEAPSAAIPSAATAARASQPTDGVGTVLFDGQIIDENTEKINERKPCSGFKSKEMNGSNIIAGDSGVGSTDSIASDDNLTSRISLHIGQHAPIIVGDSGHPRLPEKQKFVGFDAPSDGDDASFSIESAYYIKDPTFAATLKSLFSSDMKSCLEPHIFPGVGNRDVLIHKQALASDARSIPPRTDVTRSGKCLSTGRWSIVTPHSLGDDPIESVIFKNDGSSALSALHLRLEFPTLVAILSVPPPCPMNVEMEILLGQFMAWMTTQQWENFCSTSLWLEMEISVSCPLPAKLMSRRFYALFPVLAWHFHSELYSIVVHKGDTSKAGQFYRFIHLNSTEGYMYGDSRVSAVDGAEVFEQMAYILLYAPHASVWLTDFILALQFSIGFASLVTSQLLSTFELGQGDTTVLPLGKERNESEADGDYLRLKTTVSFGPDSTEWCHNVSLGGENGAGDADKGQSLTSERNIVADGVGNLSAERHEAGGCLDGDSGFLPRGYFHECVNIEKMVFEKAGNHLACVVLVAYVYESGDEDCDYSGVKDCEELDGFLSKGCESGGVDAKFAVVATIRLFLSESEISHQPGNIPINAAKAPTVLVDGVPQCQWMIQWSTAPATLSWKSKSEMLRPFLSLSLADKAIAMDGGVDRGLNPTTNLAMNEQPDRAEPAPITTHSRPKK